MSIHINSQKYKIIKELGEGGNGKVYQVLNKKNNKYYAIKKISIKYLEEEDIELIKNEANILSSINDEHIVKYFDSSQDENDFNILMEYCEGLDLKKFINKFKVKNEFIDEKIIYTIALDLCLGIKIVHENLLIHRDLKPENLFIDDNYKIKIGDFGISKKLNENNRYAKTSIGTNNYMAPEVIKGEKYNNKVDIWSFGCIIYELFTLNVCFESKSLFGFVDKIVNKPHGKINTKMYNSKWQDLIDLLLKKNYKNRPDINQVYELLINIDNEKIKNEDNSIQNDDSQKDNKNKTPNGFQKISLEEIQNLRKKGNKINNIKGKKKYYF